MDEQRKTALLDLQQRIGYSFHSLALLDQALTHSSYINEVRETAADLDQPGADLLGDYERLEFLGDAVIDLVVSHLLMERFPRAEEGDLSKLRARLVNLEQLCRMTQELGLDQGLRLGKGEAGTGGADKPSILADIYEACIGAIYLDGGYDRASSAVSMHFERLISELGHNFVLWDYKTLLQEMVQARFRCTPSYQVVGEEGPDHAKTFEVVLHIAGSLCGRGQGRSKKEAEQKAAKEALALLSSDAEKGTAA